MSSRMAMQTRKGWPAVLHQQHDQEEELGQPGGRRLARRPGGWARKRHSAFKIALALARVATLHHMLPSMFARLAHCSCEEIRTQVLRERYDP